MEDEVIVMSDLVAAHEERCPFTDALNVTRVSRPLAQARPIIHLPSNCACTLS